MLIATAVVGAGPPSLFVAIEELPELFVEELDATFARILFDPNSMLCNNVRESWAEVIV
jgi:hypothetical protein